ncbi:response regulator (positive) in two-component regulatory system with RcsC and YojN [Candidatus Hamiltonella defensa 5AT (Acyrthosiphon pisum)]|uniref:Transcriptional regulatory protein RcsB n=1 Tax=Hamiltonella defensa subsp. Acyrthosiphon pisum (strain 5AT) TaxID=572265 RepID=C4K754_HAMD5|nr:response regulator (positive) in two-component regulatory system with RcsC and YojN [Candidatus Hamiltonella defensa 5AT (Acyrthosiphon pisum)]
MTKINVIVADDHPIVLFGIRKSLESMNWINIVGEFEDSTTLIESLPKLNAEIVIIDLCMPGDKYGDGITLLKYIQRHYSHLELIVLTMNNNPAIINIVLALDIARILLKRGALIDLPHALRSVKKGKKFISSDALRLLEKIRSNGDGKKSLSAKEGEVLRLFSEGSLVTEIAQRLNRSIKTISTQKKSAMVKLGVDNDIALLNYLSSLKIDSKN